MKRNLLIALFSLGTTFAFAQAQPNLNNSTKPNTTPAEKPLDGFYKKSNILDAKVTPYAIVREADVMYRKRIWREIDLRDKMNSTFAAPKMMLINVMMDAVIAGELTAYSTKDKADITKDDDEFNTTLKPEEAQAALSDSTLVQKYDKDGNKVGGAVMQAGTFNPDSVLKFRIKEDWFFDKQRSIWEPRILGIAPMKQVKGEWQPAFWIYFPEARQVFVTKEVVNGKNDATGLSYDDIFVKRIFASYIVKESNPQDLRIKDYAIGIDKLYEAERVKKSLIDTEHDLWSY